MTPDLVALPTLLAAVLATVSLALLLVALATTAFGLRQPRYEGWRAWMAALWLAALGAAAVAAALPSPTSVPNPTASDSPDTLAPLLALALLLPLPTLALRGLRQFHPRQPWPGRRVHDLALLLVALALLGLASVLPAALGPALAATAIVGLHGHAAVMLLLGPRGRDQVPVQGLAVALAAGALPAPAALLLGGSVAPAHAAGAALVALVLAFVAIALVCERTERQLRDSRRRLRVLANLDSLTQVPNRRHFEELAEAALSQDEPGSAALLQFDIDHFKHINDYFGHAAGDRALQLVTHAMLEQLRAQDVPGRQGGDEFVLLLRRTTPGQALGVAQRIAADVQKRAPSRRLPTVSLSVGVVQVGIGESLAAALRRADQALYEAKRQGRSCAVAAEGDEHAPVFGPSRPMGLTAA
jgi:diguanylate cyclase